MIPTPKPRLVAVALLWVALAACSGPAPATPPHHPSTAAPPAQGHPSLAFGRELREDLARLPRGVPPANLASRVETLRNTCDDRKDELAREASLQAHLVLAACLNLSNNEFLEAPDSAMALSYLDLAFNPGAVEPRSRRSAAMTSGSSVR